MTQPAAILPAERAPKARSVRRSLATVEVLHFDELCGLLDPSADFGVQAARLIQKLDRHGIRIDTGFARKAAMAPTGRERSLLGAYRAEVQRIPVMVREQETRFCMGLELLWRRLQRSRVAAGMPKLQVERWPGGDREPDPETRLVRRGGPRRLEDTPDDDVAVHLRLRYQEFVAVRNELLERNLHIVFRLLERYRSVGVA
ncbi:MAG TPA: hypothetical protein VGC54_01785, partial [Planctomycetota bacterium]